MEECAKAASPRAWFCALCGGRSLWKWQVMNTIAMHREEYFCHGKGPEEKISL